ncbi:MAG: CIA30 family protein, partial [Abditibacteriales bacterium]|nr:CIA30 family protein [Abditibacteriales bacterium]MDW8367715.1 hypothetical protein [Abditibacteriales bacterium]
TLILASVLALGIGARHATRSAQAQGDAKTVKVDDFESGLLGWAAIKLSEATGFGLDGDAKLSVTNDKQQVKTGKGSLFYSYDIAPNTIRLLAMQRAWDLREMKSLRLWVKCSHATVVLVGLTEKGGANYQEFVYCPQGTWQEVTVNLDELTPDDPAKDSNRKLDLDQIESLQIADLSSFLVLLLPELKGARVMWLDDVEFSSKPVTQSTGATKNAAGKPVHIVDNFETPVIRWAPLSFELAAQPKIGAFDATLTIDPSAPPGGGKQSLKATYPRQGMKVNVLLRGVEKMDLKQATALHLWLKTSRDSTLHLSIKEKDESTYRQIVELKPGDGWKELTYALSSFMLQEDSQDENNRLDAEQIKEITLADVTTVFGGAGGDTDLWVDEVQFVLGN